MAKPATFQDLILTLQDFWSKQGCLHPAALRHGGRRGHVASGDDIARARPTAVARRLCAALAPAQGWPLRREPQPAAALLPVPGDPEAVAGRRAGRLSAEPQDASVSIPRSHDIRFVEDDWENPTLGAWGLGWEVWCDGMEVTQFTYFQQVGGFDCAPVSAEITYGLERLAMYVQGIENVYDLKFNDRFRYGEVFLQNEQEFSAYNFERAEHRHSVPALRGRREGVQGAARTRAAAGAARLRPVPEGEPQFQSARCARRDQRDRARLLYRPRAHARQSLLRSLARKPPRRLHPKAGLDARTGDGARPLFLTFPPCGVKVRATATCRAASSARAGGRGVLSPQHPA